MILDLSILNVVAKIWCLLLIHLLLVSVITVDSTSHLLFLFIDHFGYILCESTSLTGLLD